MSNYPMNATVKRTVSDCPASSAPRHAAQGRVELEAEVIDAELKAQSELLETIESRLWPVLAADSPAAEIARIGGEDDSISPVSRRMRGIASHLSGTNRRLVSILSRLEV